MAGPGAALVSLFVLMCHTHTITLKADLDKGIRAKNCRQQLVTNSLLSDITAPSCRAHGMIGAAYWISNNLTYSNYTRWRLRQIDCVVGGRQLPASSEL